MSDRADELLRELCDDEAVMALSNYESEPAAEAFLKTLVKCRAYLSENQPNDAGSGVRAVGPTQQGTTASGCPSKDGLANLEAGNQSGPASPYAAIRELLSCLSHPSVQVVSEQHLERCKRVMQSACDKLAGHHGNTGTERKCEHGESCFDHCCECFANAFAPSPPQPIAATPLVKIDRETMWYAQDATPQDQTAQPNAYCREFGCYMNHADPPIQQTAQPPHPDCETPLYASQPMHEPLLALLIESQTSIGGDWRERRDAAINAFTKSKP